MEIPSNKWQVKIDSFFQIKRRQMVRHGICYPLVPLRGPIAFYGTGTDPALGEASSLHWTLVLSQRYEPRP